MDATNALAAYRDADHHAQTLRVMAMAHPADTPEYAAASALADAHRREANELWQQLHQLGIQHLYQDSPVPGGRAVTVITQPADATPHPDGHRTVSRDYHDHSIAYVREEEQRKAAAEISRLTALLEISAADRVKAVLLALRQVRRPRGGTHNADCWQRHAHCLAGRIHDLLDGETD